jgi:hypothetical protein
MNNGDKLSPISLSATKFDAGHPRTILDLLANAPYLTTVHDKVSPPY